ncbi:MAG: energy transducer TonB [Pseudomonadota bacterium]
MRFIVAVLGGIAAALALFWVMHTLIAGVPVYDSSSDDIRQLNLVRAALDAPDPAIERRKPAPPDQPQSPPPSSSVRTEPVIGDGKPQLPMPAVTAPDIDVAVVLGDGPMLASQQLAGISPDQDIVPILRVAPVYPRKAALDRTEGWVDVEVIVAADGTVAAVSILASQPRRVFDRAAQRAVEQWRFRPRIVDGQPVARTARTRLEFKL